MSEETVVATPEAVAPANVDTVINDTNINEFSSKDIETAINNFKEGKVKAQPVAETPKEAPKTEVVAETPAVETPVAEVKSEEVKAPEVVDASFDEKVAKAVEAKIESLGLKKAETVEKPEDKFYGYKSAEEFQAEYDKDPVSVFGKVVGAKVKAEMEAFKAEVNQSLQPIKQEHENKQVNLHLDEVKVQVKEMSDPKFYKQVMESFKKNPGLVQQEIDNGRNPYIAIAKVARAENIANYEKSAYDRGVKETEARLSKQSRAVVEGGGKVIVDNGSINLETATSAQIEDYLKRSGKA